MITFFLLRPLKMQWNVCFEEKYWSLGRLISSAYLRSTNTAAGKYNKYSWQPFSHLSADGQLFLSANLLSFRCQKMRKGCVSLSSTWSVQRRAVPNCPFWQSMATFCTHSSSIFNSVSVEKRSKGVKTVWAKILWETFVPKFFLVIFFIILSLGATLLKLETT